MVNLDKKNEHLLNELRNELPDKYEHCVRTMELTRKLTEYINQNVCKIYSTEEVDYICEGAILHDVGKLDVSKAILNKQEVVTVDEYDIIKLHTNIGAMRVSLGDDPLENQYIYNIVLDHHERVDGNGYAHKTEIPFYVQIVSICDVYDALVHERPYKMPFSPEEALKLISTGGCGAFSKILIEYLENMLFGCK